VAFWLTLEFSQDALFFSFAVLHYCPPTMSMLQGSQAFHVEAADPLTNRITATQAYLLHHLTVAEVLFFAVSLQPEKLCIFTLIGHLFYGNIHAK
jgi:hypothetical protein